MRILLIEDSDADALRMKRSIERSTDNPPRFTRAIDLAEGIRRCSAEHFDVVLLDLNLPDSLGFETVERFMAQSFDPQPAVVVLTAEDDDALATRALQHGVEDYLVKGVYGPRPVHRILRHSVERRRMAVEREAERARLASESFQGRQLADEIARPIAAIRADLARLAESVEDEALGERLRSVAREAERVAKLLETERGG